MMKTAVAIFDREGPPVFFPYNRNNSMIKLRSAIQEDAPDIVKLLEELGYKSDFEIIRNRLSAIEKRNGVVIVAVNEKGEVSGCVHAFTDLRLAAGETGEIASLVVKSEARGKGVGKKLVKEAMNRLAGMGCKKIRVRANGLREKAHQFYLGQGFREIKSQKVFMADI